MTIVVSAPVSTSPWVATFERNGATLAADELNAQGGVTFGGHKHKVVITVRDNGGSPQRAAADARAAVAAHAAALIIDGVGAGAVADVAKPADLPVFVVFDGGASVVDPTTRPTLFRMAPADKPMSVRLADYLAGGHPKVAVVADDSSYGADGMTAIRAAFRRDEIPVVSTGVVAAGSSDVAAQVLAARRAGATTLVVWAGAPVVAAAIGAARSAGWNVPIWAGPSGEDPLVRQQLASHVGWLDGVGFVSFRITSETGITPFADYRAKYEKKFGVDKIGVQQGGKDVVQPPDWSMFPYDTVRLVAAALSKSGGVGAPLLHTLEGNVVVTGANGDERGYSQSTREGVSPDDMYFARFRGFTFAPVTDDLLSQNLPAVDQLR
ncbi:MAG TPA: ABC transporter substrate-binding protein [Mycobacteriales bacterium]|nr:ABC transporter substrate-binding protein [Mycobacteriales bacterium]